MGLHRGAGQQMVKCGFVPITINEWPLLAKRRTTGPNALFMVSGRVSNCFHLSALLVQMLPNSVKNSARSWEAGGGARGSQCSLFTIYNSALLLTSGQGVSGWGGGVSSRKESTGRLRRRNSFIVFQSDETLFLLEKSTSYTTAQTASKIKHFCFSSEWEHKMD